jgi:phage terminase small subunit
MSFTKKQRVFIEEYLQCWNATEAARRAGYSERTANRIASNLLSKVDIQEKIKERIAEKAMSADEVLTRLAEQARGTHSEYMTPIGPDMKALVDDNKSHLIKKFRKDSSGITVEFYDAQAALVHLGRHHKLFTDKQEFTGEMKVENIKDEEIDRAISTLAETIREGIPGKNGG